MTQEVYDLLPEISANFIHAEGFEKDYLKEYAVPVSILS